MSVATSPPAGGVTPAGAAPTAAPSGEACPLCGAPLHPDQEWCLSCGAAARTRLAASPSWKGLIAALAVVVALALGVLAAALVSLAGGSSTTPATTRTVTTAAALTSTPTTVTSPTGAASPGAPAGTTSTAASSPSGATTSTVTTGAGPAATGAGTTTATSSATRRLNAQKFREDLRRLEQGKPTSTAGAK